MTTVFPLRIAEGVLSVTPHDPHQSQTHRGIEQTVTTNSSVRQFFAATSKTANSKAVPVSVTRADVMLCELIVEQNIPLAKSDDMLTKAMKLNLKYEIEQKIKINFILFFKPTENKLNRTWFM